MRRLSSAFAFRVTIGLLSAGCLSVTASLADDSTPTKDKAFIHRFVLRVLRESQSPGAPRSNLPNIGAADEQRPDMLSLAALASTDAKTIREVRQALITLERNERNCATAALRMIEMAVEYQQLPKRRALRTKVWDQKRKKLETDFAERKRQDDEHNLRQSVPIEANPPDVLIDRGPREQQRILTQNGYDRQSESLERQRERSMRAFEMRNRRLEADFDSIRMKLNQYIKDGTFADDPVGQPEADHFVPLAIVIEEVQSIRDELRHKLSDNSLTSVQRAALEEQSSHRERASWQQPITANILIDDISSYEPGVAGVGAAESGRGGTGESRTPRLIIHGRLADRVEVHITLITRDATYTARNVGDTIPVRLVVPANPENPLLEVSAIESP